MKNCLTLFFCFSLLTAAAQTTPSVFEFKTAVTINPTVLAATDNTALFGAEHRLRNNHFALVLDAGYVFGNYYVEKRVLRGTSGFMLRPGLKYYGGNRGRKFLQLQVSYKQADYKLHDWLGKGCVNGVAAYEQLQTFTYRKTTLAFDALAGILFRLSDAVLLELYGGVGAKIKSQRPTESGSCYRTNEGGFLFNMLDEHSLWPTLPVGVKILVPLK